MYFVTFFNAMSRTYIHLCFGLSNNKRCLLLCYSTPLRAKSRGFISTIHEIQSIPDLKKKKKKKRMLWPFQKKLVSHHTFSKNLMRHAPLFFFIFFFFKSPFQALKNRKVNSGSRQLVSMIVLHIHDIIRYSQKKMI